MPSCEQNLANAAKIMQLVKQYYTKSPWYMFCFNIERDVQQSIYEILNSTIENNQELKNENN